MAFVFTIFCFIFGSYFISSNSFPYYNTINPNYTLTWEEDFNTLNTSRWNIANNYYHAGNSELNIYINTNVYVSNGSLVLQSLNQSYSTYNYTSGWVDTKNKFGQAYGRFEVSARLPYGKGLWPAHWLMPNDNSCWPTEGEIDIMELIGRDPGSNPPIYGTLHWSPDGSCGNNSASGSSLSNSTADWVNTYHLYAVDWTTTNLTFSVDYTNYWSVPATKFSPSKPFYVILNTAVGGSWPGSPNANTVFPQYHYIDYVRVYAETSSPTPSVSPSATPSRTPSTSPSPSVSSTPSRSPSVSPSVTPSVTPSRTPSTSPGAVSPSSSPSPSRTPSTSPAVVSPSVTPSTTPSRTPSTTPGAISPSQSPSRTPTPSVTPSPSSGAFPSSSSTPSRTPSTSPASPSTTPSTSPTPSITSSPSRTPNSSTGSSSSPSSATTNVSPSKSPKSQNKSNGNLSLMVIVPAAAGGIMLVGAATAFGVCIRRRRRQHAGGNTPAVEMDDNVY